MSKEPEAYRKLRLKNIAACDQREAMLFDTFENLSQSPEGIPFADGFFQCCKKLANGNPIEQYVADFAMQKYQQFTQRLDKENSDEQETETGL